MFGRQKIAVITAEFFGTATLAVAIFSMARYPNIASFFPAVVAGLTLGLLVLIVGPVSGAHVNPAVTLGLWSIRKIKSAQAVVYIAAQLLGGLAAWMLLEYLTAGTLFPLTQMTSRGFDLKVMISEAIGTFVFTFGIAATVTRQYEGLQRAAAIGTSLTVGVLVAAFASNGILNPAVAIGLRSVSVAYIVGPIIGGIVGMNVYSYLFTDQQKTKQRSVDVKKKSTATTKPKA